MGEAKNIFPPYSQPTSPLWPGVWAAGQGGAPPLTQSPGQLAGVPPPPRPGGGQGAARGSGNITLWEQGKAWREYRTAERVSG